MAHTPRDTVGSLLRHMTIPKSVKAAAWDAFHNAKTPDDLTAQLKALPLPQTVRADLWDLKAKQQAAKESKMLPRESKFGRYGDTLPAQQQRPPAQTDRAQASGTVSSFIATHFRHFNAATLHDAAEAYKAHLAKGGQMLVSLAGAMSTAELGRTLAPMIRQDKVHCISCTGANLEEAYFLLIALHEYERYPDYTELRPDDDAALAKRNINRVTDVGLPEQAAMTPIEKAFRARLTHAAKHGERLFPHEILYEL